MLGAFIFALSLLVIPYVIVPAYASEPSFDEILNHFGFTNTTDVDRGTFPQGRYEITLYAEFAAYRDQNNLSYYEDYGDGETITLLFNGPDGGNGYLDPSSDPSLTKTFTTNTPFGLSMVTPEGYRYYTETAKNTDGMNHTEVYQNLDEHCMFLIGFENLYATHTDRDYNDMVVSLKLLDIEQVIPEVPFGTILSCLSMSLAFLGFAGSKRFHH